MVNITKRGFYRVIIFGFITLAFFSCENQNNPVAPEFVNPVLLEGIALPVTGMTPAEMVTETDRYTGTITWSPNHPTFQALTIYTATITLKAKTGFSFQGMPANNFRVSGAISKNANNSGIVTAMFPRTDIVQWERTESTGRSDSGFNAVAVDPSGNIYAAGAQRGVSIYTYGSEVTAESASNSENVVLVKYDSKGTAKWARTVSTVNIASPIRSGSNFYAVAADTLGNIYAAGYQNDTGVYTYGDGVTAQGTAQSPANSTYSNVLLVKYDPDGTPQWARTVSTGTNSSCFNSVAVDSAGNVYAAGYQWGDEIYTYGPGITTQGFIADNAVLVKFDPSGTAQWAKTFDEEMGSYRFNAIVIDAYDNVYAAGSHGNSVILVKYDTDGSTVWARTVIADTGTSSFNALAVDSSGNIYAAGSQGSGNFTYAPGVSVQSNAASAYSSHNVVLVKYNSDGTAQWARTVGAGKCDSSFNAVAVDPSGNVFGAGRHRGESITYGPGVQAQGIGIILVKYDTNGIAKWARTVRYGSASFNAAAVDLSGNVFAAGFQSTRVNAQSYTHSNALLICYDGNK